MVRQQQFLDREDTPRFEAVVDESVLHRVIGSRAIMRAQLERMLELSGRPNIILRVIPYEAGALPAGNDKFIVLKFASAEVRDVVFIEGLTGDLYLEDPGDVETYSTAFRTLVELARSPKETREVIAAMIPSYRGQPGRATAAPGGGRGEGTGRWSSRGGGGRRARPERGGARSGGGEAGSPGSLCRASPGVPGTLPLGRQEVMLGREPRVRSAL